MNAHTTRDRWSALTTHLFAQNQFAIKLGLDSMNRALRLSGHENSSHKVVLIAGTNGKGTLASSMSSLLVASGLKVGLYTSPHLRDFSERFRINGAVVSKQDILEVGEPIMARFAQAEADPCLTFFELTTLMAVHLFEHHQVDVAIYEVGLGGRLDATNALSPDVCVLGSIGYDHQRYLGETLEEILYEKLGILRPGVPLFVSGQTHQEVHQEITTLRHQPLYVCHRNLGLQSTFDQDLLSSPDETAHHPERLWWYSKGTRQELDVTNWGQFVAHYQHQHVVTALAATYHLLSVIMKRPVQSLMDNAALTIGEMRWPGRLQYIQGDEGTPWQGVELLCDAAHNVDGIRALVAYIKDVNYRPDLVLFTALKDKPIEPMISCLLEGLIPDDSDEAQQSELKLITLSNSRAMHTEELVALAQRMPQDVNVRVESLAQVFASLQKEEGRVQRVLVCGSIYLLGELFGLLEPHVGALNLDAL